MVTDSVAESNELDASRGEVYSECIAQSRLYISPQPTIRQQLNANTLLLTSLLDLRASLPVPQHTGSLSMRVRLTTASITLTRLRLVAVYLLEECKALAVAWRIQAIRRRNLRLKRKLPYVPHPNTNAFPTGLVNPVNGQSIDVNVNVNGSYEGQINVMVRLGATLELPPQLAISFLKKQMRTDLAIAGSL